MNGRARTSWKYVVVLVGSALALAAVAAGCGGGGSKASAATFCTDLDKYRSSLSSLVAADQGSGQPAAKAAISKGDSDLQVLVSVAPADIKPATTTLESAFHQWASNGDDTVLRSNASITADRKLLTWHQANCT